MASPSLPITDEPTTTFPSAPPTSSSGGRPRPRPRLAVDVSAANDNDNNDNDHDGADNNRPRFLGCGGNQTPAGVRGRADLRSPGAKATPLGSSGPFAMEFDDDDDDDDDDATATDDATDDDDDDDDDGGVGGVVDHPPTEEVAAPAAASPREKNKDDGRDGNGDSSSSSSSSPLANFITQTDRHGRPSTPRLASGGALVDPTAGRRHQRHHRHHRRGGGRVAPSVASGNDVHDKDHDDHDDDDDVAMADAQVDHDGTGGGGGGGGTTTGMARDDACETIIDGMRRMCCCLLPGEEGGGSSSSSSGNGGTIVVANMDDDDDEDVASTSSASPASPSSSFPPVHPIGYSTRGHDAPPLMEEDSALNDNPNRVRLLPQLCERDYGKKCLVLDLDETLVHSSFRAVSGADFVIPVQIEDVVHFVYVAKRPGVDDFLLEMSKHYEIVIYTASLNKYADVLLDLLDPHRVIRTRLFRESCVFYEGNYVKDLCLLNRDLSQTIIIDNSPASYMFHPENAIDCSSFIDDVSDRELDVIGKFLVGIKDVRDVRGTVNLWRHWPNVDLTKNHRRI